MQQYKVTESRFDTKFTSVIKHFELRVFVLRMVVPRMIPPCPVATLYAPESRHPSKYLLINLAENVSFVFFFFFCFFSWIF